ncbi:MAG: hypothetical protein AAFV19_06035 [Pseudomonadota bacterium]
MTRPRIRIATARVALVVAAILVAGCSALRPAAPPPDYSHLLRIQVSVEWDGERIDFDELVFCGARRKGTLTSAPTTQVLPSHYHVTRPTANGGRLRFHPSWIMCSLGQSVWRPGKTPETEFKAPREFMPVFLWVNSTDPEKATYGEYHASETYDVALPPSELPAPFVWFDTQTRELFIIDR